MGCEVCREAKGEAVENLDGAQIAVGGAALKEIAGFLERVDIFKTLAPGDISALARICVKEAFEPNNIIVTQGDPADSLYCISKGMAKAIVDAVEVANLMPGDYFGENAILRSAPRHATILAETKVSTIRITRRSLNEINLLEKLDLPERKVILGGRDREVKTQPPTPKTDQERSLMVKAIHHNKNLAAVAPLSDKFANKLVDAAWTEKFSAGTHVITEGDLNADYFYIVKSGNLKLTMHLSKDTPKGKCVEKALNHHVGTSLQLGPGDSFGEYALLYYAPRAATITAVDEVTLWVIDRMSFKLVLSSASVDAAEEYVKYLEVVESFRTLDGPQKLAIAGNLMEMFLEEGEIIFEHGEAASTFYIMLEGKVGWFMDGEQKQVQEATPGKAEIFGQRALIEEKPQEGTLKVLSQTAKVLYMDKTTFDMQLGCVAKMLNDTAPSLEQEYRKSMRYSPSTNLADPEKPPIPEPVFEMPRPTVIVRSPTVAAFDNEPEPTEPIHYGDLKKLGVLGAGGFGLVELAEHTSGRCFALKAVSKGWIVECGMIRSIKDEKRIQLMVQYPFIIRLFETYNTGQFLYFLMEPALGGELRTVYSKQKFTGKHGHAVFYTASVILAISHLHSMKVMYRDLKSCNVMLNSLGWPKLTDLGLAKVVAGKTYTTIGTPEYTAPEIIGSQGYTVAVDWWALGVLLFELMAGSTPFDDSNIYTIHLKISKGIAKVKFPTAMDGPCKDLVNKLCAHKPAQRIAMKKGGVNNVKSHEWYADMNFDQLEQQSVKPPFRPEVKSKSDMTNFLRSRPPQPPQILQYNPADDFANRGWDKDFATQKR